MNKTQALAIIANLRQTNGYKESQADLWLEGRLQELEQFIGGKPETTREHRRQMSKFEDDILNLIDERDDFTRSDLQGMVTVVVSQIYKAGKADQ